MDAALGKETEKQFTGKHMLMVMLGFFGVIISVNLVLAYFAAHSWTGLVVKNSYVASQHFNETLQAANAQKALGWQSTLKATENGVVFHLSDKASAPLNGYVVNAIAKRPTHEQDDFSFLMESAGNGEYRYRGDLAKGAWVLDVTVMDGDVKTYRQIFKVVLR